ncbi:MAG TPA: hypothetical protein VFM61_05760 [Pseudidiomarina sp.]|nr:hypothetical protein [Pseudidiomarina sp.]
MSDFHQLAWTKPSSLQRLAVAPAKSKTLLDWHAPALKVAESFAEIEPLQLSQSLTMPEVESAMHEHGVRYACIHDDQGEWVGIIQARELHSRHSTAVAGLLQLKWSELSVQYVMQSIKALPVLSYHQVAHAQIGDIAATLQAAGRDFALIEKGGELWGLISSMTILQRTGESIRLYPKATTFVEVFSALRHPEIADN